jgi:Na+-driven multidrug efflux pump
MLYYDQIQSENLIAPV